MKLHNAFELKVFKRGQCLYKLGDKLEHIYIIKSGEFEISAKIMVDDNSQKEKTRIERMINSLKYSASN